MQGGFKYKRKEWLRFQLVWAGFNDDLLWVIKPTWVGVTVKLFKESSF